MSLLHQVTHSRPRLLVPKLICPGELERGLSTAETQTLRARLREIGPQAFIHECLEITNPPYTPRLLGTSFGIPLGTFADNDGGFLKLLGFAIIRAYNKRQKLPQYNTVDDAAALLKKSRKIVVITGAGISTSLGVPDFRSKGTGFYDKITQLGYTEPEEVFEIGNFDENPSIFYSLAGDILPQGDRFTPTHAFIRLLQDQSRLQTNYTQNIDNLEELAGIERSRLIQCHGSFATATCRKCGRKVDGHELFDDIRAKRVPRCTMCLKDVTSQPQKKRKSSRPRQSEWEDSDDSDGAYDIPEAGVMKPDITFFGEKLSNSFFMHLEEHVNEVDLVIVIGTSLKVAPVSEIPNYLPHKVPHIYISREPIEHVNFDIQLLGECDHVVFELCKRAGWDLEHEMIPKGFGVKVQPADDSASRWFLRSKQAS